MGTILSIVLALLATVVLMWLNGKQHEFDKLQDKPK